MDIDYGYGELENKLIRLLRTGAPDFSAAEELIRLGADINAVGNDNSQNILSRVLKNYRWTEHADVSSAAPDYCEEKHGDDCEHDRSLASYRGQSMCTIIRFFLKATPHNMVIG